LEPCASDEDDVETADEAEVDEADETAAESFGAFTTLAWSELVFESDDGVVAVPDAADALCDSAAGAVCVGAIWVDVPSFVAAAVMTFGCGTANSLH
jgi:hypothetical protein